MMEPASFAVGIVGLIGLFKACLDVIEKVDSYRDFGVDSRAIIVKFEADKHLFTKWAQDVGISKDNPKNNYHTRLNDPETKLIVHKSLSAIQAIFSKTEGTMSNLQPVVEAGPMSFPNSIGFLDTRQKSQKNGGAISKRARIGWSLRGKARFVSHVQQFEALIQTLYSLVPPDRNDLISIDKAPGSSSSQRLLIEMEKQIERETRKELDIWLGTSWTNDVYDNFIRRRLDGTCDWILSRQAFLDWISPDFPSGTAKILWIHGPAGHGKTILCATVVQHLSLSLESPLAYYFCSSDSEDRRDPLTIVRSWISQVVSSNRDVFELACGRWEMKEGRNASQTDIGDLFKIVVQHVPNCTFIVDGIDECAWAKEKWKSDNENSPLGFFEFVKRAVAHTTTRILIFSRNEPEIRNGFRTVLCDDRNQSLIEYQICPDDVRSDATSFSRSIVDKKLANKSETIRNELSQRMVDRCNGMFLWVKMQEEQLRGGMNKKQLEAAIDQAPTALDRLYDRNWINIERLPEKDRLRALSILRWAAFALRPLTVLEITEALLIVDKDCEDILVDELPDTIDEDYVNSEILGLCGSLLEIRKTAIEQGLGSKTIHLAHFSIKQYILCNMPAQGGLLMVNGRLHISNEAFQSNVLAKLCLRYLNFRTVWQESFQLQGDVDRRPFRDYAAESWCHHTRDTSSNYGEVVEHMNTFFSSNNQNNQNWESWTKWFYVKCDKSEMTESQRQITSNSPLFFASLCGLRDTIIYLLEGKKLSVNHVDGFNRTGLQAAALKGQTLIVKLLLEKGADVAIVSNDGWTPLNSASSSGHIDIVKLLLEKRADMTIANNDGWTPLNSACNKGHIDIVKLLLEKGVDMTITNNNGWTPLNSACNNGHVDIVKLLLEKGADMTIASNNRWTPLNFACDSGHVDIIKLLLKKGADMAIVNNDGWTPLNFVCIRGHVDIVKLLLKKRADMTIASNDRWTPLNCASDSGHVDIVKLLLEKGADMTIANKNGWTPLNCACNNGHVDIVKLLLEKGAELELKDIKHGQTPLMWAAVKGHVDTVKLLLENGAELESKDIKHGQTPLMWAAEKGHEAIVQLLLEKSADKDVENRSGCTSLEVAVLKGHRRVENLLAGYGAFEPEDIYGFQKLFL